ncbi:MAG: hypothetical protein HETSPECPRED_000739 [Heterodermia speciosa]|uniref:Uncharacterized protein n=1 Tax=Heterodermia speciosa TaxID=116794 RepID=A0A8H3GDA0_9LECA|nr:MAG: hypothetical protein HETSPECPRED_000739 [Heterodermia speciosa]
MDSDSIYDDPQKLFAAMAAGNPHLPLPNFLSLSDTRQMVTKRSEAVFADRDALRAILERYEETLRKRWGKKTGEQRRKVLVKAYPGIPAIHRPDFAALRREGADETRSGTRFRDAFLLPSMNLEDLMKPKPLLMFLNARGRQDPDIFANADFNSVHLANTSQAIMSGYMSGYTMLLLGQKSASSYGRLISWDDDDTAFDKMSTGIDIQPGEGLLILEIQERKLGFLRSCAESILQDLPLQDTTVPVQPSPVSLVTTGLDNSEWPSLSKEILEAPYSIPDQYDVERLRSFVLAKIDEAVDHIWLLREDPLYYQDTVRDWSEHRQEKILSVNGKTHPVLRSDTFWERVLGNMISDAYLTLVVWNKLSKLVDELNILRAENLNSNQTTALISEEYQEALCHFSYFLDQMTKGPILHYKTGMPASPPLRSHFSREPQDPNTTKIVVTGKSSSFKKGDHFLWALEQLLMDNQVFLYGLENLLDEIERMVRSNGRDRERVSSWVARILSDLSLLAELRRQMGLLHPGPAMTEAVSTEEQQEEFSSRMKLFIRIHEVFDKSMNLAGSVTPLTKFNYPSEKSPNATITKKLQSAERNLDKFWEAFDKQFLKHGGENIHSMLAGILPQREIRRTPDWEEIDRKAETEDSTTQNLSSRVALIELEARSEKTISPEAPMQRPQKVKTRGTASESVPLDDPPAEPHVKQPPKFIVSKRGLKVFSTLFHTPSGEDLPGEVPWSDFLSAMASVAFSIKALDGSAWVFEPQSDLSHRSIIFHEPHPTSKIPFQTARRYGRRLERAYGWTQDSFSRS